ncbi:MAG: LysE family transporter [Flavobacteriaceae bacterium]
MTTVKISLKENKKRAISFAAGVSTIVIVQAYIAVAFSKYLLDNSEYLMSLQKVGVIIFLGLSIYFFNQVRTIKKNPTKQKESKRKGYVLGILFSLLNMFAIPFYSAVTSSLAMAGWYEFKHINNILFVLGSSFGTFFLLSLYATLASKIEKRIKRLANQMDLFLGIITGLVGIINLIDLLL